MLNSVKSQYETTERKGNVQNLVHLKEPRRLMPSQGTLDKAADRAFSGGYNVRNICPDCRLAKPVSGSCCQ